MGFIRTIFGFIIAITLVAFAVSNRQTIPLNYSPVHEPLELPLYFLTLVFMAAGFLLGAVAMWLNTAPTRRRGRQQRKTIKALEKEIATLGHKSEKTAPNPPAQELFPALSSRDGKNTALPEDRNSSIT
ncbi:MAG: LapA family protein [Rhodospirillales bacterium]|nr:LapA family protein [Rhodospirillales bacterium]